MKEILDTAKVPLDTLNGSLDTQKEFLDTLGRTTARAYGEDLADFSRWFKESDGKTLTVGFITTKILRSGVDIVTVAALLGHSRIDTTAVYTQPSWRDLERAVDGQGGSEREYDH